MSSSRNIPAALFPLPRAGRLLLPLMVGRADAVVLAGEAASGFAEAEAPAAKMASACFFLASCSASSFFFSSASALARASVSIAFCSSSCLHG